MKIRNLLSSGLIVVALGATIFMNGCKKEDAKLVTEIKTNNSSEITSKKGMLIFSDRNTLNNLISEFNTMNSEQRQIWESKMSFLSQESIFDNIRSAEIAWEEELFSGYDESLSSSELEALGVVSTHTDIYYKYKKSGLITEIKEADGSSSYTLGVVNPAMAYVINEDGLVVINDTIFQYTTNNVKAMIANDLTKIDDLKEASETQIEKGIYVFNVKSTLKGSNGLSLNKGWVYNGSDKRMALIIYQNSIHDARDMVSIFYVEAKGQGKRWGRWDFRNNYSPIDYIRGSWSFEYSYYQPGVGFIRGTGLPNNYGKLTSPVYRKYGGSNYVKFPLHPDGQWGINSPNSFADAVKITDYNFVGSFFGGCCGIKIEY